MKRASGDQRNFFGGPLYDPRSAVLAKSVLPVLRCTITRACLMLNMSPGTTRRVVEIATSEARLRNLEDVECTLRRYFRRSAVQSALRSALEARADLIAFQVRPFLLGDTGLDIGCGDGLVAWKLRQAMRWSLVDVMDYRENRVRLPFKRCHEGERLPARTLVDTSLLVAVLHHSVDPARLLREAARVTRRRCVVIESVVRPPRRGDPTGSVMCRLSPDSQHKYACYVDWFYNHCMHEGVPVPFNFAAPIQWRRLFRNSGWTVMKEINLGIEQALAAEHHYLFVLDRHKSV